MNEEKCAQFGEMVRATERAATELSRPWRIGCAALAVVLVASTWKKLLANVKG